ncbi:MAG: hypothetical protein B9S29_01355 [Opitutia bacterium Tous-C2FEB]|jgi:ABC-type uncharacterized transport system permease subunit|nr:MAG: hypothetical protein B9S29_01355 [Opitutae bacterium Tous-C2FEB]PAZ02100.1 MAG: hypothetical protein CAK89_07225 [Opitutae bacterium AMD-G3]
MALLAGDTPLPLPQGVMAMACAFIFLLSAAWDWQAKSAPGSRSGPAGGLWLLRAGWLLLTVALAADGLARNTFPVDSSAGMLLSIGWGLAGLAIFLDLAFDHRLPIWVIASATTACVFSASRLGGETHAFTSSVKPLILLHIGAAILAYCLLAAQALNALAYLLQDRALAQRKFGGIYGLLPALVPMDKIGANLMGAAVWMLALSVVIGAVDVFTGVTGFANFPKLVMAGVTLLLAVVLLALRRRASIGGAAFARGSLWLLLPALAALWLSLPSAR